MAKKKATKKEKPMPTLDAEVVEEDEKKPVKTASNFLIVGIVVVIGLIIYGAVWFATLDDSYEYNGFTFYQESCPDTDGECWKTIVQLNVGARELIFFNDPKSVEDIPVDYRAVYAVLNQTTAAGGEVIITFDEGVPGEVGIAAANIARVTGDKLYQIPTRGAVYGDVTCGSATPRRVVIYLTQGPVSTVMYDKGCVVMTAPTAGELTRVADAYTQRLLFIIPTTPQ